jgi:hypothetical protein
MKKYGYTHLDTIKTYEGDNIIFAPAVVANFIKGTYYKNILNLSKEEKDEWFHLSAKYVDILEKLFDKGTENFSDAGWIKKSDRRTPTEEFDNYCSQPKDEDLTDEEHELKMQYLREYKEWFEKQNS